MSQQPLKVYVERKSVDLAGLLKCGMWQLPQPSLWVIWADAI